MPMKAELADWNDGWSNIGATHQSLHFAVTTSLREAILKGRFKPGERLTESNLADIFKVSRNPIREALRALQVEGLIEVNPRRGARVRLVSDAEAQEVIELRAELEGINARNAARRCDGETRQLLVRLQSEGNEAAAAAANERLRRINDRFHALLADAGQNRYLADYVKSLRERTLWLFASAQSDRAAESWREHAAILQAVITGDAELAALLAARHVRKVGEQVRFGLNAAGEPIDES
ncbi:MAG: GntR family transcriptional regulator [Steroidobacteraceae bacterium]